ncbi:hypothetical protein FR483_n547L [Paramecium bursaria Chlorella virus FR483]|uniref:Uncharacterized protein n547L n=1 Tax=Paramecium bursaria Chlorella virus FR483 TaxID=399781 RepID=A7J7Q1_PBCVF|nr:hypothetical protein FR483_n547L [Paramecium bursaria Chlorella virus FR483]ABT15832.1 hypothetical protein FR483_n547L [Paramecium bursaria Chlorella virus FR483]
MMEYSHLKFFSFSMLFSIALFMITLSPVVLSRTMEILLKLPLLSLRILVKRLGAHRMPKHARKFMLLLLSFTSGPNMYTD